MFPANIQIMSLSKKITAVIWKNKIIKTKNNIYLLFLYFYFKKVLLLRFFAI